MELPFLYMADGGGLCVSVDLRVYGQEALLKAVHRFTDRCYLHLEHRDENTLAARFQAKPGCQASLGDLAGEFCNELLDQQLRSLVQRESEPVRNLILAHALSRTSLIAADLEEEALLSDPGLPGFVDAPSPQVSDEPA